ncbi:MAG: cytochrome P450 [Caldilineaceae bacterium]|nr:cytochrome P450 [Caldilineaceae bacterium]
MQLWFDEYGDVVYNEFLGRRMVYVRHPEHIHDVVLRKAGSLHKGFDYTDPRFGLASFLGNGLLTNDGESWKRQRKLVQPAFHMRRIAGYADTMVDFTLKMLGNWRDGKVIQLDEEMSALTMQIVVTSLFSEDVSNDVERVSWCMNVFQDLLTSPSMLLPAWLPTPIQRKRRQATTELDQLVYGFMADWRRQGEDKGDLLSMLMMATDEENGVGMGDKQIRDELVTLLLAGHETTANALNWTFYLLSQHPDAQTKLHQEVDTVLGTRKATLVDLDQLCYTKAIIEEAMRLYPPAWSFARDTSVPLTLGDFQIPQGTEVRVMTYNVHRDERWWPNADAFQPERFLTEDINRPKYAYIPFGGGPRICIGNQFAMMEAQLALATIAQRYSLRLQPSEQVVAMPKITLVPKYGIKMRVEERGVMRDA